MSKELTMLKSVLKLLKEYHVRKGGPEGTQELLIDFDYYVLDCEHKKKTTYKKNILAQIKLYRELIELNPYKEQEIKFWQYSIRDLDDILNKGIKGE